MKHSYDVACECSRCSKERARRDAQSLANAGRTPIYGPGRRYRLNGQRKETRRPVWGSQEWAETRGDDLGESPDY
jgi:hypothetical protein